jgi:hypothetical protein
MTLIRSYARIKPKAADKEGGRDSDKRITGWDAEAGIVEMNGKKYDHVHATLPPDVTQQRVYEVVAQPLVGKWLDGYDVDVLSYGQTGSGKTYTMFGPPFAMEKAAKELGGGGGGTSSSGILKEEHGFILRCGFEALAMVESLASKGVRATLHGSMVEVSIMSFTDQSVTDLLNKRAKCYVDKSHHLQGAMKVLLRTAADVVKMAAAVETRLTRGTKMNDTSSRSHCITVFEFSMLDGEMFRQSRMQFFDLMGSERFKGANSAHNTNASSKSSMSGYEGIFANLSLSSLMSAVEAAAKMRRKGSKKKFANPMMNFALTDLLQGSLSGKACTGMITCLSQSLRNGDETYLSLKYGAGMSKLLNDAQQQPLKDAKKLYSSAKKQYAKSKAIVDRGVNGKYQALRMAEVRQWEQVVNSFQDLLEQSS